MNQPGVALGTVEYWIRATIGFVAAVLGVIEAALRQALSQVGIGTEVQSVVIVVVMVVFIAAVLRLFAGLFRVLLVMFLIVFAVHALLPIAGP